MILDEFLARFADCGMNDPLQRGELLRVRENDLCEALPVECPAPDAARKQLPDLLHQVSARSLQLTNDCISVEHGHPRPGEYGSDRRLAHPNRPRERHAYHARIKFRSRNAPSKGRRGIPRMVKWSPSMDENNCTP